MSSDELKLGRIIGFTVVAVVLVAVATLPSVWAPRILDRYARAALHRPQEGLVLDRLRTDLSYRKLFGDGATVTVRGSAQGLPYRATAKVRVAFRGGFRVAGELDAGIVDAGWRVRADAQATTDGWTAKAEMPPVTFSERDPVVAMLLEKFPMPGISNLTCSGSVACSVSASQTNGAKVATWSVKAPIRNLSASVCVGDKDIAIRDLSVTPGASGLDRHVDIAPLFVRMGSVSAAEFTLTNLTASIRATETSLLVTESSAGFCGGTVRLYALHLDPQRLNAGFSLYLEDIDAGQVLGHLPRFDGTATGRLNGRLALFVREGGRQLRIRDACLYSTPGEVGKLRMNDATVVTDNLAMAGVDAGVRDNVANALTDLDYSVLRLDLRREAGDAFVLTVRLGGEATRGDVTVPVNFDLTFRGAIEQLINTGLRMSGQGKGKRK